MIGKIVRFPTGGRYEDGSPVDINWIGVITGIHNSTDDKFYTVFFPCGFYKDYDSYTLYEYEIELL